MEHMQFRAWDKVKKKMLPVALMDFVNFSDSKRWQKESEPNMESDLVRIELCEKVIIDEHHPSDDPDAGLTLSSHGEQYEPKQWVIMQSTGLRDGCRNLIFESDIVQWQDKDGSFLRGLVVWVPEMAMFTIEICEEESEDFHAESSRALEIIGNSYEHPKLLE